MKGPLDHDPMVPHANWTNDSIPLYFQLMQKIVMKSRVLKNLLQLKIRTTLSATIANKVCKESLLHLSDKKPKAKLPKVTLQLIFGTPSNKTLSKLFQHAKSNSGFPTLFFN